VRVGYPGGPRLELHDRNPIMRYLYVTLPGTAPHSPTNRASYTVPSGKKAKLMGTYAQVIRVTAATTLGRILIAMSSTNCIPLELYHLDNTVNSGKNIIQGETGILLVGEVLVISTADLSTAGTVDYYAGANLIEFDA